jgi:hypothetical protein
MIYSLCLGVPFGVYAFGNPDNTTADCMAIDEFNTPINWADNSAVNVTQKFNMYFGINFGLMGLCFVLAVLHMVGHHKHNRSLKEVAKHGQKFVHFGSFVMLFFGSIWRFSNTGAVCSGEFATTAQLEDTTF